MAKLKAPLLSLAATGNLGEGLVYSGWKGVATVRENVPPTNPQTLAQQTHRARYTYMVAFLHAVRGWPDPALSREDIQAYNELASLRRNPCHWYNELMAQGLDQLVAGYHPYVFLRGSTTPAPGALIVTLSVLREFAPAVTDACFRYGRSRTSLVRSLEAPISDTPGPFTIDGLETGVKYWWQVRPTDPPDARGVRSGLYYGYPL